MALLPPGGNSRKNAVLKRAPHCQRLASNQERNSGCVGVVIFIFIL